MDKSFENKSPVKERGPDWPVEGVLTLTLSDLVFF